MKKKIAFGALLALVIGGIAYGGSIKVWTTGESLKSADLNSNLAHIHNLMVGGHGARLVDADVNASAAIAHSKMATPALLPKAWAFVTGPCDGSLTAGTACTVSDSSQVTSVTTNGTTGQYRLNLAYTPANANFGVWVTSGTAITLCTVGSLATTTPNAVITCKNDASTATNAVLNILVMDT